MEANYLPGADDIYVSPTQVRKFGLRTGDTVEGEIRAPKDGERYFAMVQINKINFDDPESLRHRINFDSLTPLYPDQKLKLEMEGGAAVMAPAVKEEEGGSRATSSGRVSSRRTGTLTKKAGTSPAAAARHLDPRDRLDRADRQRPARPDRAPPPTGKTMLLQNMAHSITRTPRVADRAARRRAAGGSHRHASYGHGEVVSSTFDEPPAPRPSGGHGDRGVHAPGRDKRDVVILLDSLTRLARAYKPTCVLGKLLSGGLDPNALQRPKRFFGAARNIEEGGSLTIIATALVETGSRMDKVIFEEFKGPVTRKSTSIASSPTSASSPRSTSPSPAPARKSSWWTRAPCRRCGCSAAS